MNARAALTCLLFTTLIASPTLAADAKISAEEWHYLQQIGLINEVNEATWKAIEEAGGGNPKLAAYARDLLRFNLDRLEAWPAPVPELEPFHASLRAGLASSVKLYDAMSEENYGIAREIGVKIERQVRLIRERWEAIAARYEVPE